MALGLAVFLGGVAAGAAEPSAVEPVALVFDAPPACPSRNDFMEEVGWRTRRVVWSEMARPSRTLIVSVRTTDSGFRGRLDLQRAADPALSRQFEDPACSEVVSALALVAALAIDPQASQQPLSGPPGVVPGTPSPAPSSPDPSPIAAEPTERTAPALATPKAPPDVDSRWRAAPSDRWHPIAGISLTSLWGLAPEPMLAVVPSVGAQRRSSRRLFVLLRASPTFAQTGLLGPATDRSVFRYFALRTEICAHGRLGGEFELGPCAVGDAGVLAVSGSNEVPTAYHPVRPWAAFGLSADIAWGSQLAVRTELGGVVPVVRDRFVFEPENELLHRTPAVIGSAALSIELHFPK